MNEYKKAPSGRGSEQGLGTTSIQLNYNTLDQNLCSGLGIYHSPTAEKNPKPLLTITLLEIENLLTNPQQASKAEGRWFIPSTLLSRVHAEQHKDGNYFALWGDIDETSSKSFTDIVDLADEIIAADFYAYTTRSATKENQKARIIIPLKDPLSGDDWKAMQKILNNKLEAAGITPDRSSEKTGQSCFLPNKGEYYESHNEKMLGYFDSNVWNDELIAEHTSQARGRSERAAKIKAQKEYKPNTPTPAGGVIPSEYIKQTYNTKELLEASGAVFVSRKRFYPANSSNDGAAGGIYDPAEDRFFTYHSNDPFSDGYWHGAIDLLCHLNGIDWSQSDAFVRLCRVLEFTSGVTIEKHNQRAHMEEKAAQETIEQLGSRITKKAQELSDWIHEKLMERLCVNSKDNPENAEKIKPNAEVITRMINGAFWSGSKSKIFLLNHDESLIVFSEKDSFKFLVKTFGQIVERSEVEALAELISFGHENPATEERAREKHVSSCMEIVKTTIINELKYYNQRESIEWRVDMFANNSRMELIEDKARIVLTHRPFPSFDRSSDYVAIVEDYKDHFSRFDEFLEFIVMSRFAIDRKKSYLWILADSDWGKGFITGILNKLGCCVETSMREIEAMFEGKPVGRSAEDFKRAFVFLIDEFKTVKSELKQLQSEINLSPKNQLTCTVEIFAKVFTSAENVDSLVTENGVEDQFANRMSIFQEKGDITNRPLYKSVGNSRYFKAILSYTATILNAHIADMKRLGRDKAETKAEAWLNDFIKRNGLDTIYARFSDSLPELAAEMAAHFTTSWGASSHTDDLIIHTNGEVYIKSPGKVIDDYLAAHFDHSQIGSLRKKKKELIVLMSSDGRGVAPYKVNGKTTKAVKI